MARQVLFVHGAGEGAYEADAKLAESLRRKLGPDYQVRYREMPDEEEPDYKVWKRIILHEAREMGDGAILVGHSIGASVLARVMTEQDTKLPVAGVFLVASPFWHDDKVWRWDEVALPDDADDHYPHGVPLLLFHGEDDEVVPVAHVDMYAKALPKAIVRRLPGRNHQLNDDMTEVAREIACLG